MRLIDKHTRERWSYWRRAARLLLQGRQPSVPAELLAVTDDRARFARISAYLGLSRADLVARQRAARQHAALYGLAAVLTVAAVPAMGWPILVWSTVLALLGVQAAHRNWCIRARKLAGIRHFLISPKDWWPR